MSGNYKLMITKSAQKDKEKIKQYPALKRNVQNLLELVYMVYEEEKIVKIISMWAHYEF